MFRVSAALAKFRCSATARKLSNCCVFIKRVLPFLTIIMIDAFSSLIIP